MRIAPLEVAKEIYKDDESAVAALEAHIHVLRSHGWVIMKQESATDPHARIVE